VPAGEITLLLDQWRRGSREVENRLFALVMPDLLRLAHHFMKGERKGHTLSPAGLVSEAYFRLVKAKDRDWRSRQHFFAIAARAMRRYLIDYARGRPDAAFVALEGIEGWLPAASAQVTLALTIDGLLDKLGETKPEWCQIVEMKFFLGLTDEETAEALHMKLKTMQRRWHEARQWLFEQLEPGHA
jgi:RNA polymerase sigma factor (TIGR02999 family)